MDDTTTSTWGRLKRAQLTMVLHLLDIQMYFTERRTLSFLCLGEEERYQAATTQSNDGREKNTISLGLVPLLPRCPLSSPSLLITTAAPKSMLDERGLEVSDMTHAQPVARQDTLQRFFSGGVTPKSPG